MRLVTLLLFVLAVGCGEPTQKSPPNPNNSGDSGNVGNNGDAGNGGNVGNTDAGGECGDGVLDPGEICDPGISSGQGACPTDCTAPGCATARLTGSADTCTAECVIEPVACADADGCCPIGCDESSDSDCTNVCGDGNVESPETCDGDCPTSCAKPDACTDATLQGDPATCSVTCSSSPITTCVDGDGCCPSGCSGQDSDCSATCGDGSRDPGEICDGDCPTTCDDGNSCTIDRLQGSPDECNVTCQSERITVCQDQDDCCPAGCDFSNDDDCSCTPETCETLGATCGMISDGCGSMLDCGTCTNGMCMNNTCELDGNGALGDPCSQGSDCAPSLGMPICQMTDSGGGFCTMPCFPTILECPDMNQACWVNDQLGLCVEACDTSADCRPGFSCTSLTLGDKGCVPNP